MSAQVCRDATSAVLAQVRVLGFGFFFAKTHNVQLILSPGHMDAEPFPYVHYDIYIWKEQRYCHLLIHS